MSRRRQSDRNNKANSGFKPKNLVAKSENQKYYIKAIKENQIIMVHGPAGSGKTHIAAASAVKMLSKGSVGRICICRPVVGVGKDIGYLPGTMEEKVGPYLTPLFDELCIYLERSKLREFLQEGTIEIVPLSMMRGRTFDSSFVILDEAQNATLAELRMLLTRIGDNTKMVLAGDLEQSDLYPEDQGAFKLAVKHLRHIEEVSTIKLMSEDIVRNPIISEIEELLPKMMV